ERRRAPADAAARRRHRADPGRGRRRLRLAGRRARLPVGRRRGGRLSMASRRPGSRKPQKGGGPPARGGRPPATRGPAKRPAAAARRGPKKTRAVKVTPLESLPLETDGRVRINRFLASTGVASRRAADELVAGGRVTVNGEVVTEVGTRIDP